MRDRKHILIDDEAGEMHDAIRWCVHATARRDVDSAMTRRVPCRRGNKRTQNLVGASSGPGPAGRGCGGGRGSAANHGAGNQNNEERDSGHLLIVAKPMRGQGIRSRCQHNPGKMRAVGERCYPFRSTQSDPGDYACPLSRQCHRQSWHRQRCTQPLSPSDSLIELVEMAWPCAGTRFRAKRCG
jgi:hypothetical protein